jgi:protein involved in polysaccharide export with SLBB domain
MSMGLGVSAQVQNVDVKTLSDSQVEQAENALKNSGLSIDEAVKAARARGASQQQIDDMVKRMSAQKATATPESEGTESPTEEEKTTQKGTVHASSVNQMTYGFSLFNKTNLTFEPSVNIPVPSDYVLSIGDAVLINVWGDSKATYSLTVDKTGAIVIPDLELGPIKVAGLNFSQAKDIIISRLTTIYSAMTGSSPTTFADVSINNVRSIKVNIIGEANAPGTYTLPATASVFNALYLSGGPNERGSFRQIKLIRNNKTDAVIDVYDYLVNGNTAVNVSLRDEDIIYIPAYKKRVQTAGAFKRIAYFELKENDNLESLLSFAGGFADDAAQQRLLLTRYTDRQLMLLEIPKARYTTEKLLNGDVVRAESILNLYENRVSIEGAVFRPGTYSLAPKMTVAQLIRKADGLQAGYYSQRGLILRLDSTSYTNIIPFDIDAAMAGTNDPELRKEDQVVIKDVYSIGEARTVRIFGEVMMPGAFGYSKNMTLKDLIFLAGGMREAASESYVEVARRNSYDEASELNSKRATLYQFKVNRDLALDNDAKQFILEPFDNVYIRRAPSYGEQQTVSIVGQVKYPGDYSISDKKERISDLLTRSGGLTEFADADGARLTRRPPFALKQAEDVAEKLDEAIDKYNIRLEDITQLELQLPEIIKKPGSKYDFLLKEGDVIYVPEKSSEVWVNGEVLNPVGLAYTGAGLKHYINNAGGFTPKAKKSKTYVIYSNGTTGSTRHFIFRSYPEVKPGSQIVVPEKVERENRSDITTWLSISSTFASIAIAIAAVLK